MKNAKIEKHEFENLGCKEILKAIQKNRSNYENIDLNSKRMC